VDLGAAEELIRRREDERARRRVRRARESEDEGAGTRSATPAKS